MKLPSIADLPVEIQAKIAEFNARPITGIRILGWTFIDTRIKS